MRKLSLWAVGGLMLSPLFVSMVASAAGAPDDVSPAVRSAMQRDLGLSAAQVAQYLKVERLASIEEKRLADAQEDERARIARELHDDVVQRLVGLGWRLGASTGVFTPLSTAAMTVTSGGATSSSGAASPLDMQLTVTYADPISANSFQTSLTYIALTP